jgi:membrane protease YdiL (CAAX protease family)
MIASTGGIEETVPISPPRARRDVLVYLGVLAVIVAGLTAALIAAGSMDNAALVLGLAWAPGLVAIAMRIIGREGFADVSFRPHFRRNWRWYLALWLVPIAVALVAYGVGWSTGLTPMAADTGSAKVAVLLAVSATVLVPVNALFSVGEELGWRGYLLPRLVQAGVRYPVAVTSVVWWLFHAGLIVAGLYASGPRPWLAVFVFGATILAVGAVAGWSRLATGSVWPAVLVHATWNAVLENTFDPSTAGTGPRAAHDVWVGESGVLVAVAALLAAAVVWLVLWSRRREA